MGARITLEQAKAWGIKIPEDAPKAQLPIKEAMNKTEKRYAAELEAQKAVGMIRDWRFEAIKLRLAKRTNYTPDFLVWLLDGAMEFREVKGFWRDDARVKIKVAAEMYPMFKFVVIRLVRGLFVAEPVEARI